MSNSGRFVGFVRRRTYLILLIVAGLAFGSDAYVLGTLHKFDLDAPSLSHGMKWGAEKQRALERRVEVFNARVTSWAGWALPLWLALNVGLSAGGGVVVGMSSRRGAGPPVTFLGTLGLRTAALWFILAFTTGDWWPRNETGTGLLFVFTAVIAAILSYRISWGCWPLRIRGDSQPDQASGGAIILPRNGARSGPRAIDPPPSASRSTVVMITALLGAATGFIAALRGLVEVLMKLRHE